MPQSREAVGKLIDCPIAGVAVNADVEILHADFEVLARHTDLRTHHLSLR